MGKSEEQIARQRQAAVEHIFKTFPVECKNAFQLWCSDCCFYAKSCQHGLAPVTSSGLPCPYYRK